MEISIGEAIREYRKSRGLSQVELAEEANLSVNSIRNYESGKRCPNIENLKKIASALDAPIINLLPDDSLRFSYISHLGNISEYDGEFGRYETNSFRDAINKALDRLNPSGQSKAVERVEELTEIPKYQKTPPPEGSDGGKG